MIKGNVKIDRKNLISILQSCLVLILVILVALMMVEIGNLKGTARVINYAGLVRGDTQRAVKLEITGTRNDELIAYLDDILSASKWQYLLRQQEQSFCEAPLLLLPLSRK